MMLDWVHILIHPSVLHHKSFTGYEMEIRPLYLWHAACIWNLKTRGTAQVFDTSTDKDVYIRGSRSIRVRKVWIIHPSQTFWTTKVKGEHILSEWLQQSEHRGLVLKKEEQWQETCDHGHKEMAISQELMAVFTFNSYFKRP